MKNIRSRLVNLAQAISKEFQQILEVDAIAHGGSQSSNYIDKHSDIDLYIFSDHIIPLHKRKSIINQLGSQQTDLDLNFWVLGDEWIHAKSGIEVDLIYWDKAWISAQIERVLFKHKASVGYTTCFWYTILNCRCLFDRNGWFADLQQKCRQPYPEELRKSIIAKNHPILRNVIPSYYTQIKKAISRNDLISINHRIAALLASYFDVLFAFNYVLNPGEKKIIQFAKEKCQKIPNNIESQIKIILESSAKDSTNLLQGIDQLLNGLDHLLSEEGFNPKQTHLSD